MAAIERGDYVRLTRDVSLICGRTYRAGDEFTVTCVWTDGGHRERANLQGLNVADTISAMPIEDIEQVEW